MEGYSIPVLNEREIRAAAGLLFLLMSISILIVFFDGNFLMMKYAITIFLTDISIRVLISPKYAPSLIIGRLIVRNQSPLYVGAAQKKFAWIIGIVLGTTMFTLLVVVNAFSPITGIICFICLIFLFFETAFGICLGCIVYKWIYKEKAQYCPGEVCDNKQKHDIQKTSTAQLLIVAGFFIYIFLAVVLFNDNFRKKPFELFGNKTTTMTTTPLASGPNDK